MEIFKCASIDVPLSFVEPFYSLTHPAVVRYHCVHVHRECVRVRACSSLLCSSETERRGEEERGERAGSRAAREEANSSGLASPSLRGFCAQIKLASCERPFAQMLCFSKRS